LVEVSGNVEKDNPFDLKPSYRTSKIRVYITATDDPYHEVRISEIGLLNDVLIRDVFYADRALEDGEYRYSVTAVDDYGFESPPSEEVKAMVGDVVSPSPPQNLVAAAAASQVSLDWSPNPEPDVAGYHVYRKAGNVWTKINAALIAGNACEDPNLPNGTYTYRVTALDHTGNESFPSNEASLRSLSSPPASGPPYRYRAGRGQGAGTLMGIYGFSCSRV